MSTTMEPPGNPQSKSDRPDYVTSLEAAYGAPSQDGFGSAVFFAPGPQDRDLEAIARIYYQRFVGKKWQEWGAETWLAVWRETYRRPGQAKHEVEAELRGITDTKTRLQTGMILDVVENPGAARSALAEAYDAPDVVDLRAYLIGDGEAMSGLLLAGQRQNDDVTILTFLLD